MPNKPINPRFSEQRFRRCEEALKTIVDRWPDPVHLEDSTVSPFTLAIYLRDARTSLRNNQWNTIVEMAKFLQICDELMIGVGKDMRVLAGPKGSVSSYSPIKTTVSTSVLDQDGLRVDNPSSEVLEALLLLHSKRVLLESTTVTNSFIADVYLNAAKDKYDIEFDRLSPTSFLIL